MRLINLLCNSVWKKEELPQQCKESVFVLNYKVKVKFTLEQAMKAQRGSRSIALLFL
jgi:hypothetical protein